MRVFYELSHKMSSMAKSSLQINECLIRNMVPLPFFPSSQHQLFVYSYSFLRINLFGSVSQLICCYPSCLSHPLPRGIRGRNRFLLPHVAISYIFHLKNVRMAEKKRILNGREQLWIYLSWLSFMEFIIWPDSILCR